MPPPDFPNEPPSEPPYLNRTASWYAGDAWYLFASIMGKCGFETAKFIFEKCIKEGAEIEAANAKRSANAQQRAGAAPMKIPTVQEIDAADRERICMWYARLLTTDQHFSNREREAVDRLTKRYIEFGGFPAGFKPRLPPIKKKGAVKRDAANAALPAMFDATNPRSAFSIEKAKRGGDLTKRDFAGLLVKSDKKFGKDVDSLLANLRYHRSKAKI
jgi:hypothetical protein